RVNAAVLLSPLPQTRVAVEAAVKDDAAYRNKYDFTTDWFSWNIPVWEKVLAPYRDKPGVHYLEIGAYEGRSLLWMLEHILTHPASRATAVDIFDGPYESRYRANVERTHVAERVTTIKGTSQVELRRLPPKTFDIIYIDGSHNKDDVL